MKKTLMVLVALVMVLAMVIGSAGTVGAGKPQPSLNGNPDSLIYDDAGIYDLPGLVYIDYSLQWANIGAWGYKVEWGPTSSPTLYYDTGGGKKLRNLQTTLKLSIPEDTIDDEYAINVTLLDRTGNPIGWWDADTVYPANNLTITTTAMYSEHFHGVASGELPVGWSTNRTDLCYVADSDWAGGVVPELYMEYDSAAGTYDYSDYWVSTAQIVTAAATSNLTLSFDHWFWLWADAEEAYPYTIAVEVSADSGTTWNATSFIDSPTLTEYPSGDIGPAKVYIDLSTYAGQNITIRWRIYGYTYMMNEWDIDNVVLTGY